MLATVLLELAFAWNYVLCPRVRGSLPVFVVDDVGGKPCVIKEEKKHKENYMTDGSNQMKVKKPIDS